MPDKSTILALSDLRLEKANTAALAGNLTNHIRSACSFFDEVPTDGLEDNLVNLIEVWRIERLQALNTQIFAL